MGGYPKCWLDDLFIGAGIDDIVPELILLFRGSDKVVLSGPFPQLPPHLDCYRDSFEEDNSFKIVYYETSVQVVRDQLNVLGYDYATVEQAFQEWINEEQKKSTERMEMRLQDESGPRDPEHRKLHEELYRSEIEILSALSPETWVEGLKQIHSSGVKPNYYGRYAESHENTLIDYMLSHQWYGFPGYDLLVPLRLAIEACEGGENLIYDLTDFYWSNDIDYEEDFVEDELSIAADEYSSRAKIVVLTEGKTDARILRKSLKVLFPHLMNYFSFLDFENSGFGGGVGNLANVVKAFAGAGIVNNVVALFDNDTTAAEACNTLQKVTLPANVVVRQLPELDFLMNYPTIGPSGRVTQNVNGMAASIELYLGEDVLRIDGDKLTPIQWTGYNRVLDQYQGKVSEKARLHKRFRQKLANQREKPGPEWDALRKVFQVLFSAFAEKNRRTICKRPAAYYGR